MPHGLRSGQSMKVEGEIPRAQDQLFAPSMSAREKRGEASSGRFFSSVTQKAFSKTMKSGPGPSTIAFAPRSKSRGSFCF